MALVADANFTNNLVSVSAFSPFPTGGGNKVLHMNVVGGGVLLDNTGAISNIGNADLIVDALANTFSGTGNGTFGFVVNRNGAGKFYHVCMLPTGTPGNAQGIIYRYSGGVGGTFTVVALSEEISIYTPGTLFSLRCRVNNSTRGPNLSLMVDNRPIVSCIDISASNIHSGQVGLASNIVPGENGTSTNRYFDNWFVRSI